MYEESSEAIEFQRLGPNSGNFGSDMEAVFQDVINVRDRTDEKVRVKTVVDYFLKVAGPKLIGVIKNHTGLSMTITISRRLMCNFAVLMEFDPHWRDTRIIINQYSGLMDRSVMSNVDTRTVRSLEQLKDLAASLNVKTGCLDPKKVAEHGFKCKLYFDVFSAFLIQETGATACEPLTAHEVSAIILHEVGHVMTLIEHAAQTTYNRTIMDTAVKNFLKNGSPLDVLLFLTDYFTKLKDDIGSSAAAKLFKIAEKQISVSGDITIGLKIVLGTIFGTIFVLGSGIGFLVLMPFVMGARVIFQSVQKMVELGKGKSSDFYFMPQNAQTCEVLADQYVDRWGFGDGLANGLKKLIAWSRITGLGSFGYLQSNSASWYGRMLPWLIVTMVMGDTSWEYPTETERYALMMEETLKAFKNQGMDKEVLDGYMKSYQQIKMILEKPTPEMRYTNLWNTLHKFFNYILETPESLIITGRFEKEYELLYKEARQLTGNELYALSSKLKELK